MNGLVTLATDFGESDWFVGVMKGVMLRFNPEIRLVDLSHRIAPHSIASAAYFLTQAYPYFPSGTVHLAVVDPGVGSGRRAAVVETAHHVLVGPDNGMLWPVTQAMGGGRWFSLENPEWLAGSVSPTFHGRDVFAPAAARLASGESVESAGPEMADPVRFEWPRPQRKPEGWHGEVLYIDRFGNCLTNLSRALLDSEDPDFFTAPRRVEVQFGDHLIQGISPFYQAADPGMPMVVWGSGGALEIAVYEGNAAAALGIHLGTPVRLRSRLVSE